MAQPDHPEFWALLNFAPLLMHESKVLSILYLVHFGGTSALRWKPRPVSFMMLLVMRSTRMSEMRIRWSYHWMISLTEINGGSSWVEINYWSGHHSSKVSAKQPSTCHLWKYPLNETAITTVSGLWWPSQPLAMEIRPGEASACRFDCHAIWKCCQVPISMGGKMVGAVQNLTWRHSWHGNWKCWKCGKWTSFLSWNSEMSWWNPGEVAMLYGTVILGLPLFVVGATFGQDKGSVSGCRTDVIKDLPTLIQSNHVGRLL